MGSIEMLLRARSGESPPNTPIVIDVNGDGYSLTTIEDGVLFDIDATGLQRRVAWTSLNSDDGWLVWDRDGSGTIDDASEMFGSAFVLPDGTLASNGFEALAAFDDNADGAIDSLDQLYFELRVWVDSNHDGCSVPSEIFGLQELGLVRIETLAKESRRRDPYGNWFLLRAKSWWAQGAILRPRYVYDVWLAAEP